MLANINQEALIKELRKRSKLFGPGVEVTEHADERITPGLAGSELWAKRSDHSVAAPSCFRVLLSASPQVNYIGDQGLLLPHIDCKDVQAAAAHSGLEIRVRDKQREPTWSRRVGSWRHHSNASRDLPSSGIWIPQKCRRTTSKEGTLKTWESMEGSMRHAFMELDAALSDDPGVASYFGMMSFAHGILFPAISISSFENNPESIPISFHPPTPSATAIKRLHSDK